MPTWTGLGVDNNWSTGANWDTLAAPIATTDAIFNGAGISGNKACTITAGATCRNLNFTGYTAGVAPNTAVITFTNSLTVRGSITLSASMGNFAGANGIILVLSANSSFTSNGKFFDKPLSTSFNSAFTMTFIDNWRVSSFTTTFQGGNTLSFIGVGIIVEVTGNFAINHLATSTNTFKLTGAGSTMSGTVNFTGTVNIEVGTGNTLNITSFNFAGNSSFKWTSGTVNHTGTITNNANPISLDLVNVQFNNYSQGGNASTTLVSDANFNNVTLGSGGGTFTSVNGVGWRLKCRGNLILQQNSGGVSGTGIVSCTGTGTITSNNSFTANFEVNSGAGAYTLLSSFSFGGVGKTVTLTSGSLGTGTTTTTLISGTTINTPGVNWYNIIIPVAATITINSLLSITATLTITSGGTIFNGTAGWTCATLSLTSAGAAIIVLQNSITYTTTTSAQLTGGTNAARYTMTSNDATIRAIWTLSNGASQSLIYVQGTRIDSSGGQPIYPFGVAPIDSLNWFQLSTPGTVAYTFVN